MGAKKVLLFLFINFMLHLASPAQLGSYQNASLARSAVAAWEREPMRRLPHILLLILVGLLPFGIVNHSSAAQEGQSLEQQLEACTLGGENDGQDGSGEWWSAVCRPIPVLDAQTVTPVMQPYLVKFAEEYGATRPNEAAEFMAVVVMDGFFALDLEGGQEGSIVVSPPDGAIEELERIEEVPYYQLTNVSIPCDPNCTPGPEQSVLLAKGDVTVAKKGTICLWCLLGRDMDWGEKDLQNPEPGLLGVYALLEGSDDPGSFSWIQDWDTYQQGQQGRAPEEQTTLAWAFSPPGSKCGGG